MRKKSSVGRRAAALLRLAYRKQWDINAVCYGGGISALVFCALILTGIIGPSLDAHDQTAEERTRKTAIAAKE